MNIFFLHPDPRRCARWHCDKHVVKMLLETCQLLYTCHWIIDGMPDFSGAPRAKGADVGGYRKSHMNHPCAKWVRLSLTNYVWLATLGLELLREYEFRYGYCGTGKQKKIHGCAAHIQWLYLNRPLGLLDYGWIEPAKAMPDIYKSVDAVSSYRRYYNGAKRDAGLLVYTRRHMPHWLKVDGPEYFTNIS